MLGEMSTCTADRVMWTSAVGTEDSWIVYTIELPPSVTLRCERETTTSASSSSRILRFKIGGSTALYLMSVVLML